MEKKEIHKKFILFTSNNFPKGGPGATYINLFCKGVTENNEKISVYLFKGYTFKNDKVKRQRKNKTEYGVNYTNLGFANRPENKILKIVEDIFSFLHVTVLMLTLFRKRKKIIIFLYSDNFISNLPISLISRLYGISLVTFVPEFYDREESKKLGIINFVVWNLYFLNYNYLNKYSNKLIVFSSFLKNAYLEKGYKEKNIIIQPNLTDLNNSYLPDQPIQYTIGYAGTPSRKDGIFDLISALKILKDRGSILKTIIIGDSIGKESYLPELIEYSKSLGVFEQILFKGLIPQSQVKNYLNCCKILAITRPDNNQTRAGFPTKLGEYMGCKRIVLATRFGDIEKYFTNKVDIVLAEPGNPDSIAENIMWILKNDEEGIRIAQKGSEKANEVLDYKKGVKKILTSLMV